MSFEKADLEEKGLGGHVIVLNESSAVSYTHLTLPTNSRV